MIVRFTDVEEFLKELRKDKPDRNIVRLTNLYEPSKMNPNIKMVSVVSTFSVKGEIVRLHRFVGDLWGHGQESGNKTLEVAKKHQETIERACKKLGYEVRPGTIEKS